jgi:exonuclease III
MINNPNAKEKVLSLKENLDLKDPWRNRNPFDKRYSWRQPTPLKQARIDFFLISHNMLHSVENCDIIPSVQSDHSVIVKKIPFLIFNEDVAFGSSIIRY